MQWRMDYVRIVMLLIDCLDRGGVSLTTFLSIIVALSAIATICAVVVQESNQVGLGTLDGSSPSSEWGSNRGTSRKDMLKRITVVSSIIFFLSTIILIAFTK